MRKGLVATTLMVTASLTLLAGCSADEDPAQVAAPSAAEPGRPAPGRQTRGLPTPSQVPTSLPRSRSATWPG